MIINYYSLPADIKKLANKVLGFNVLKYEMSDSKNYQLEIRVENGYVAGFTIFSLDGNDGYIDAVCVEPSLDVEKYEKSLILEAVKRLSIQGATSVSARVRFKKGEEFRTKIHDIFHEIGFAEIKKIEDFYINEKDYLCSSCNESPDSCGAVFYYLTF